MSNYQSTIKHNDHLLLDQSLLRLPYELLRNNFRAAHFIVEKENAGVRAAVKDAATGSLSGNSSPADLVRSLDAMIAQARGLKQKLSGHADEEANALRQLASRVSHLDELYGMNTYEDVKYEAWSRTRLDRLLIDYLLRLGYGESASALAEERGMRDLVDIDTFLTMNRIGQRLIEGSVAEALAWCGQHKKELRKMELRLEFELRLQQYIEIVRSGADPKTCIAHAKKHLIPHSQEYPKEVRAACGMLAFPSTKMPIYNAYFAPGRWQMLAGLFTEAYSKLLSLPSQPPLHVALSIGLSALKTPACHSSAHKEHSLAASSLAASALGQQSLCPICSTELNDLAKNVPYAHHTKSHVDNDLMLLPNLRVYGRARLDEYARKSGLPANQIKDLRTGEVYDVSMLKKVFIT